MRRALALAVVVWLAPLGVQSVAAQTAGPMTVERIHSGFLAAPEVKVTELDHKTSELVGGFAGLGGKFFERSEPLGDVDIIVRRHWMVAVRRCETCGNS